MSASKTLFSWDVPLKNIDWGLLQEKWPNLADYATKRPSFDKLAKGDKKLIEYKLGAKIAAK